MKKLLLALLLPLLLGGCATRWVVDSEVKSFSSIGDVPQGAGYRFERLPSQEANEAGQRQLEGMAEPALAGVGLRRDDANPRYSAQVNARVRTELSPWADPWLVGPAPWGYGYGFGSAGWYGGGWRGRGAYGGGWYGAPFGPPANPWYAREVSIVLRELSSNRVVYETHARNDGPYNVNASVLPVMFQAALQGFPNPPPGERRVDLELPSRQN